MRLSLGYTVAFLEVFVSNSAFLHTVQPSTSARIDFKTYAETKNREQTNAQEEKRGRWEVGRAAKTALFFGAFPSPPNPIKIVGRLLGGSDKRTERLSPNEVVYSPTANRLQLRWGPLDDVVMGGSSKSSIDEETGVWSGTIVAAGGGFSGIRTRVLEKPLDLSQCKGVKVRVSGMKGKRMKLILRDEKDWNGVAWSQSFDTAANGGTTEVELPFSSFVPTKYARVVQGLKQKGLDTQNVMALQLTYSKFEYEDDLNPKFSSGPFEVQIESISTF